MWALVGTISLIELHAFRRIVFWFSGPVRPKLNDLADLARLSLGIAYVHSGLHWLIASNLIAISNPTLMFDSSWQGAL